MKPAKSFKIQLNIRKASDFGQAISAVSKAIQKAGRHGIVSVEVPGPEGTEEALGQELLRANQELWELRALVKQQSECLGARVGDPGSEEEPSGDQDEDQDEQPPAKETKAEKKARLAAEKKARLAAEKEATE